MKRNGMYILPERTYLIAATFSLLFLLFGISFIFYAFSLNERNISEYIRQTTKQTVMEVENHIEHEFENLIVLADLVGKQNIFEDTATFSIFAKSITSNHTYLNIGFTDVNAQAVWMDKRGGLYYGDFSKNGFVTRALNGQKALSRSYFNKENNTYVNYYAVPIYDATGSITGTLFAANPEDELRETIDRAIYAGNGLAHIIDSEGNYIIKSKSPLVINPGNNIFDLHFKLPVQLKSSVLSNLAAARGSYFESPYYDGNRLVAYAPLNINAWHIFYAVPENKLGVEMKTIIIWSVAIIAFAAIVSVALLLIIKRISKQRQSQLESIAYYNSLTKLPNLQKFLIDAAKLLKNRGDTKYALLYIDIKGFKYINDLFGREVGNRLLRYWGNYVAAINQKGEVCAHVNADIFVSLRKYTSRQDLEARFEGISRLLGVYPEILARGYKIDVYGGAYLVGPEDDKLSVSDMLDRANTAQQVVKSGKKSGHFNFYSAQMREEKIWQTQVEARMDAALESNEFEMYLQPKIAIQKNCRVIGAEALVRWESPDGYITPDRFIDIFEKNGFILQLDRYIFEKLCRYYRENILNKGLPTCILSANVSRMALWHPDFIKTYTDIKNKYAIPDQSIELEFTESLAFENHTHFQTIVSICQGHGFLCSLDDFGAGYSSLNILKSIHVDILKLDRLFFQYGNDPERGKALVKSIIDMAKALNMKTVAEGIDSMEQVDELRTIGCDAIQGYVFAKPMPGSEFLEFIQKWPTDKNPAL